MTIIQVIIDKTTSMIIEGTYEFQRDQGGMLIVPSGSTFPTDPAPVAKELFWRTDESKLYRRSDANDSWVAMTATAAAHAASHEPGGGDAMAVDAVAGTGSLRTLGTTSSSACAGNDARLSDARTPTAHATTHKSGNSDAIKLDELAAPTDITTLNATTSLHGLLPKLDNDSTHFMNGQGAWAVPSSVGGLTWNDIDGYAKKDLLDAYLTYLDIDGYALTSAVDLKADKTLLDAYLTFLDIDGYVTSITFDYHSSRHESGGADAIKIDDLASPDDNTDLNATTSAHGLLKKLDNDDTHFMNGQGTWAVPAGGGGTQRQEVVTTQAITGDTALTDHLDYTPQSGSLQLYLNGVFQQQGATKDYTLSSTTITWLASSGTAVDMDTSDILIAKYVS